MTNVDELGIAYHVIQGILRHSTVEVTRQAYIERNAVDARNLAAMTLLETPTVQQSPVVN